MFNTFYSWISAHHSVLVSSFAEFLSFVLFLQIRGSLVYFMHARVCTLCTYLVILKLLIKKGDQFFILLLLLFFNYDNIGPCNFI
jgi:hypothetical protein